MPSLSDIRDALKDRGEFFRAAVVPAVRTIHYLVLLFVIFGPLAPWGLALKIHAWSLPLLFLQWKLNRNTCILTNLEHYLLGEPIYGPEGEGAFIKGLVTKFKDPPPSDRVINIGTYVVMFLLWTTSVLRLQYAF